MMRLTALSLITILASFPAHADGDAAKGADVFKKCMPCHSIDQKQNKVGPYLVGVVGRKAATAEGYNYSDALKKAGADGLIWDETSLSSYVTAPKIFLPGNRMTFAGLKKPEDVENLIAYLKTR